MSRASYNTSFDTYAYPASYTWGAATGGPFAGRLVSQDYITQDGGFCQECYWWLTTDELLTQPSVFWTPGDDFMSADLTVGTGLAIPSGNAPGFVVVQRELVEPWDAPSYYRYLVRSVGF